MHPKNIKKRGKRAYWERETQGLGLARKIGRGTTLICSLSWAQILGGGTGEPDSSNSRTEPWSLFLKGDGVEKLGRDKNVDRSQRGKEQVYLPQGGGGVGAHREDDSQMLGPLQKEGGKDYNAACNRSHLSSSSGSGGFHGGVDLGGTQINRRNEKVPE